MADANRDPLRSDECVDRAKHALITHSAPRISRKTMTTLRYLDLVLMDDKHNNMDYKYTSIDENRRGRYWLSRNALIGAAAVGAVLVAALSSMATYIVMISIKDHGHQQLLGATSINETLDSSLQRYSCGETFDDAHQRGCTFDPLTLTWLHPKCSKFGQEEFLAVSKTLSGSGDTWRYYEERGGQHLLGGFEALSYLPSESGYWTTQEEHLHHCMWMLLRVHDAAMHPGTRLDTKSASFEHTKHCLEMLVDQATIGAGDNLTAVNVNGHAYDIGWTAC